MSDHRDPTRTQPLPALPPHQPAIAALPPHEPAHDAHAEHGKKPGDHGSQPEELGFDLPAPAKTSAGRLFLIGAVGLAVLAGAFLIAWVPRHRAEKELVTDTKNESGALRVQVISPKARASDRALVLPGSVQPLEEAVVYPRANGYIKAWKTDIGDHVKEGALLADIEVPEIDQQLLQAQAQLAQAEAALVQAKANQGYSQVQLGRYQALTPKGVASEQELDRASSQSRVDSAGIEVANANVEAQKANLRRYAQLREFARVVAPFDGIVNARMIERGTLVSGTTPLFRVSQSDTVRVFIQVPQDVAPGVAVGQAAQISIREYAGRAFDGKIARSAGALDMQSRTMTVEIRIPNEKHELITGMYAEVKLTLPSPHKVWEVPATTVLTDARGIRVAIVEDDNKLHMSPVIVERDNGATMELANGIKDGDRIVKLASSDLAEGRAVEVQAEVDAKTAPTASPEQKMQVGPPPNSKTDGTPMPGVKPPENQKDSVQR